MVASVNALDGRLKEPSSNHGRPGRACLSVVTRLSISRIGIVALCCLAWGPVHAGPPYRTDDPEPPEFQHFEIYTFSMEQS